MPDNLPAAFNVEVYKECRHNFAASIGQVAYDGCQEFYSSGNESIKEAMLCAACKCHRSFHRKETVKVQDGEPILDHKVPIAAEPCSVYFPDDDERTVTDDEGDDNTEEVEIPPPAPRRRTRTVFTAEQKERMVRFAECYDWRPYKRVGREVILQFCSEIGITGRNFQVWLGNSRRRPKDKNPPAPTASSAAATSTSVSSFWENWEG